MLDLGSVGLQRIRTIVGRLFHKFGIHCATHQIRVILISCVVITSLFYPALALYASSQIQTLSDSRNLWSGHTALRIRSDAVSRARCGLERTVRVERVLMQSPLTDDALNHQILLSTLQLERRISDLMTTRGMTCLRTPTGECFVLSPLAFWNHSEDAVRSDSHVLDTLSLSRNITVSGMFVTPRMVLAGPRANDHTAADFDFAMFLAVSYFFPETNCLGSSSHAAFLQILETASQGEELVIQAEQPTLIALEYDPDLSRNQGLSAISAFLYLAYVAFFAYVTWSMRRMTGAHSRIGLTFTALVEITVSTITSLSVCALVGFKVTLVPWELLPIVIVFVGAENMFNLVDAVTKTSVTLPVKQRVADGLSRAGTSNSLKVLSYNAILGSIAFFAVGAIRQFCVFAIVVLVAHWFLAHTFFMAVLSIDVQRLELEELLRQNASLTPAIPKVSQQPSTSRPISHWKKLVVVARSLLQGRATKNISLLLLLATTATLYYTTHPASTRASVPNPTAPRGALARSRPNQSLPELQSPAWNFWKLFNPEEDPLLHLRIEQPTILTFRPDVRTEGRPDSNRPHLRSSIIRLAPVLWLLKIVVLPIAATTFALYGLLLYLLKDAELLEAQRNHSEDPWTSQNEGKSLQDSMAFTTLPRALATDVDLLAASKDEKIVASIGMQNELVIWRTDSYSHVCIDVTDVLLRAASTSAAASRLTAVAVDDTGRFCAAGTGAGVTAIWIVDGDSVKPLTHLWMDNLTSGVQALEFVSASTQHLRQSQPNSPAEDVVRNPLLVVHDNGLVVKWDVSLSPSATLVAPHSRGNVKSAMVLRVYQNQPSMVAYVMQDGTLEVVEVLSSDLCLSPEYCMQPGNPADPVSLAHACRIELGGSSRLVIGAATKAGVVSLWDGATAECIAILDEVHGEIDTLRISPVQSKACNYCGELPLEKFAISFSARQRVLFYTAYLLAQGRRCSCPHNQPNSRPGRDVVIGRRSRTNSLSTSISLNPLSFAKRRQSSAAQNGSPASFPVSAHGVHSRRASEKESLRRQESLSIPLTMDEHETTHAVGPIDSPGTTPTMSGVRNSLWQNVILARAGDAMCDRGCWDVWKGKIVGVRRRSRASTGGGKHKMPSRSASQEFGEADGLTDATLERWELWSFDPSGLRERASSLDLLGRPREVPQRSGTQRQPARLPFTRVNTFVTCSSRALAGFGNTVGVFASSLD